MTRLGRDWGEVGQVFRLQRERRIKQERSVEVVYGWTSLSPQRCSPQRLLHLIRCPLDHRKSAPLAARCNAGRGPVRRPSSTGGGNVGGPQYGGALLDGSLSSF